MVERVHLFPLMSVCLLKSTFRAGLPVRSLFLNVPKSQQCFHSLTLNVVLSARSSNKCHILPIFQRSFPTAAPLKVRVSDGRVGRRPGTVPDADLTPNAHTHVQRRWTLGKCGLHGGGFLEHKAWSSCLLNKTSKNTEIQRKFLTATITGHQELHDSAEEMHSFA